MRTTDRIPGFAICARCGARRFLAACASCGILVCGDCRGTRDCAVCFGEQRAAAERQRRRTRLRELGRRAAVVAMVAASGVTGLSAAFVPSGPLCTTAVAPVAVELRIAGEPRLDTPLSLESTPPMWAHSQPSPRGLSDPPLAFNCFQARSNLTCCVVGIP